MTKEKLVRTFLKQKIDTFEDFQVAVKFMEATLNNGPVFANKGDQEDFFVVTPAMFLNP